MLEFVTYLSTNTAFLVSSRSLAQAGNPAGVQHCRAWEAKGQEKVAVCFSPCTSCDCRLITVGYIMEIRPSKMDVSP